MNCHGEECGVKKFFKTELTEIMKFDFSAAFVSRKNGFDVSIVHNF